MGEPNYIAFLTLLKRRVQELQQIFTVRITFVVLFIFFDLQLYLLFHRQDYDGN